ncbi:glycosyltransferase family 2 protein [Actinomycetospora lemnae]|uniref:glycosyltransferase family 2 protein n=1 Tax=Actinomycetospora lemnae TaxID=3019891 RepID=UPI0038CBF518
MSVIVPTYNRKAALKACLRSLDEQTVAATFEVVVVDDGSTDGTVASLVGYESRFELYVIAAEHLGPSNARNLGISKARGRILAFTEDDVVVGPEWLERSLRYIDSGADVVDGRTVYVGTDRSVRRFEDDATRPPAFIPCNLVLRRQVYDAVGGYDPAFFDSVRGLYFREDSDFAFRVLDAGFDVRVAPDVVVEHPVQFVSFRDATRHTRRYELDALLHKKHRVRYRRSIEMRNLGRFTIPRPMHYVCLIYGLSILSAVVSTILGRGRSTITCAVLAWGCSTLYRFRYQGPRALRPRFDRESAGFLVLPGVYLYSICRGALRYRSFGVLR